LFKKFGFDLSGGIDSDLTTTIGGVCGLVDKLQWINFEKQNLIEVYILGSNFNTGVVQ